MASRKISVEIVGDASSLSKAFGKAEQSGSKFGSTMGKLGKAAAFTAGGAALGGLFVTLNRGIGEFKEGEQVAAQTAAAIKSTGKAANVTAKQVSNLATAISNYSGIDDEAVQSGENMLLTFTNIRNGVGKSNKIFDQATKTLADMSVATGTDMRKAAIQLGKALNDPIKGVGALSRVGVTFTTQQKKQIKTLVDSGKTMEAQKIILKELQKEFGGSAKAAGDTFAGSMHKLTNAFDNLAGNIVGAAAPAIQHYVDKLNKWLSKSENQARVQKAVKDGINLITNAIGRLKDGFDKVWPILQNIVDKMGGWKGVLAGIVALKVASKIGGMTGALGGFNPRMNTAATNTDKFGRKLGRLQNIGAITIPIAIAGSMKGDSFVIKVLKSIGVGATAALILGGPAGIGIAGGTLLFSIFAGTKDQSTNSPTSGSMNSGGAGPNVGGRAGTMGPTVHPRRRGAQGPTKGFGVTGQSSRIGFSTAGIAAGASQVGSAVAGGGMHFHAPVYVQANDPQAFIRGMQKWASRGSSSRSGPYGGYRVGLS